MPTVRVDDQVYSWLESQVRGFDDTPNLVLRRVAKLDLEEDGGVKQVTAPRPRGKKTPMHEFSKPILQTLLRHGGGASRSVVLAELEKVMSNQLTSYDKEDIPSGDCLRWQKSAEWMVHTLRKTKLLIPAKDGPNGHWILTDQGEAAARQ
jgi:hypothetical protein